MSLMTQQNKLASYLPSTLMTEEQVVAAIKREISLTSLTAAAQKYSITRQQLSDIVYGRATLSKRVLGKLQLKLWPLYERMAGSTLGGGS